MNKYPAFIFVLLFLLCGCEGKDEVKMTPWGTVVGSQDTVPKSNHFTLSDIIGNGEMIALTISGPDTYYDYHGHGLGVQYMMCEDFAREIGVTLRVEVCKDTTEMIEKLVKGYGDVIAVPVSLTQADSSRKLRLCGVKEEKTGKQWAVLAENEALADSLNSWYRADMPAKTLAREDRLLAQPVIHSASFVASSSVYKPQNSSYTELFKQYAGLAGIDWRLLAAQCYQESAFDPQARSWAGACGLMQLMPATAARFGLSREDIFDPEKNIAAGARYMGVLLRDFSDVGSHYDRINFALAAYNGGPGHIRDAMALAGKYGGSPYSWESVAEYVLLLRDAQYYQDPVVRHGFMRGSETVNYVASIRQCYGY